MVALVAYTWMMTASMIYVPMELELELPRATIRSGIDTLIADILLLFDLLEFSTKVTCHVHWTTL